MTDLLKKPWSIWTAEIFHDDGTSKNRPVIVLNDNEALCLCDVCIVTSQVKSRYDAYEIIRWKEVGLKKPSMVVLEPTSVRDEDFRRYVGTLDETDIKGLIDALSHGRYGSKFTGSS